MITLAQTRPFAYFNKSYIWTPTWWVNCKLAHRSFWSTRVGDCALARKRSLDPLLWNESEDFVSSKFLQPCLMDFSNEIQQLHAFWRLPKFWAFSKSRDIMASTEKQHIFGSVLANVLDRWPRFIKRDNFYLSGQYYCRLPFTLRP